MIPTRDHEIASDETMSEGKADEGRAIEETANEGRAIEEIAIEGRATSRMARSDDAIDAIVDRIATPTRCDGESPRFACNAHFFRAPKKPSRPLGRRVDDLYRRASEMIVNELARMSLRDVSKVGAVARTPASSLNNGTAVCQRRHFCASGRADAAGQRPRCRCTKSRAARQRCAGGRRAFVAELVR